MGLIDIDIDDGEGEGGIRRSGEGHTRFKKAGRGRCWTVRWDVDFWRGKGICEKRGIKKKVFD